MKIITSPTGMYQKLRLKTEVIRLPIRIKKERIINFIYYQKWQKHY